MWQAVARLKVRDAVTILEAGPPFGPRATATGCDRQGQADGVDGGGRLHPGGHGHRTLAAGTDSTRRTADSGVLMVQLARERKCADGVPGGEVGAEQMWRAVARLKVRSTATILGGGPPFGPRATATGCDQQGRADGVDGSGRNATQHR